MSRSQLVPGRLLVMLVLIAGLLSWTTVPTVSNAQVWASSLAITSLNPALDGNAKETARARASSAYAQLPMRFESNEGQFDAQVKFAASGAGYALVLTRDQAVMSLYTGDHSVPAAGTARDLNGQERQVEPSAETNAAVIRMKLVNANSTASVSGENELPGRSNYFFGNDPAKWRAGVSSYSRVVYKGVYRGVDLVYYGKGRELEYDLKVAAGANSAAIRIRFEGAKRLRIDPKGDLVIGTNTSEVRQHKPVAYQEAAGKRREVSARYVLRGKNQVSFALGSYDRSRPLVIDPVLVYSTYLGGMKSDQIYAIAVDAAGNAYVTGGTYSPDFPVVNPIGSFGTFGPFVLVSKLNPAGSALIYSTYINGAPNGNSSASSGLAITLDAVGNAYVTGQTNALNFPTTPGAFQATNGGTIDSFALKLNAAGSALVYSTYLGGIYDDIGKGIAVDATGNAYVTGRTGSPDFPRANAMQPSINGFLDAFITKVNATGTALVYSTFLGGRDSDSGNGIALDAAGNAYVTGATSSDDFPIANALQPSFRGRSAFSSSDGGTNWAAVGNAFPITTSVTAVAIDPLNSLVIYIGSDSHGLFKSIDGGGSWKPINNGIPDLTSYGYPGYYFPITDLEIDTKTPSTMFAGTSGAGGFKSSDGGHTWNNKVGALVTSVKIDPTNPATVYAADNIYGLFRSTDSGENWSEVAFDRSVPCRALAIAPTNPSTVYVGLEGGGMLRFGGGIPGGYLPFPPTSPLQAITVDPLTPATIYSGGSGMFKSTDSGNSWMVINDGLLINGTSIPTIFSLAVDPQTPNTIYAGGGGMFKSTNGGANWSETRAGLPTGLIRDIVIDTRDTSHIYAGTDIVEDAFVSKLSVAGSALAYSTYLGGLDRDGGDGIAIDAAGNVYVAGTSYSTNIPGITSQRPRSGISDAFVLKLAASGTLSFFTYIGGSGLDQGSAMAIDSAGNSYVTGNTTSGDFPTTPGAIPVAGAPCANCTHAFVTKLNQSGATLLYSTYLGGNLPDPIGAGTLRDRGNAIAVDPAAAIYVAGFTYATNFPVTSVAFDPSYNGIGDGFVTRLEPFDLCVQDDSTPGSVVLVNPHTGDYRFCCEGVLIASGRGSLTTKGSIGSIDHIKGDRTVHIQWDSSTNNNRGAGSAIVQTGPKRIVCQITDSKMLGDSCVCQ